MPDGTTPQLTEPSMRDALAAVSIAAPMRNRRHWQCSLRIIAKALGKPPELIPARVTALRWPLSRLHHTRMDVAPKTLANHKANVRAALRWFAQEESVPLRGAPLAPDWQALMSAITEDRCRKRLSSLMRYASANRLDPLLIDDTVMDSFMHYRASTTAQAFDAAARRQIARAWNNCADAVPGWPSQRLTIPETKSRVARPTWDELPETLRLDIEAYLAGLEKVRRISGGRRQRPCLPKTIKVRKMMLLAFIRKAVASGYAIDRMRSFKDVLQPDLVDRMLDLYWSESGEAPSVYTIDLASLLYAIAKQRSCLDENGILRLEDMRAQLARYRRRGLTDKNMLLVREILASDRWQLVLRLPWELMQRARLLHQSSPVKAAGLAQMAVAIGILTIFPVRLSNLASIRIGKNLTRPGAVR